MRLWLLFFIFALAFAASGCSTTQRGILAIPQELKKTDKFIHPSGFTFPVSVSSFRRVALTQYDTVGENISAGYNSAYPREPLLITVYVYPAPNIVSIASPSNVVAAARSKITDTLIRGVKSDVYGAHPGAILITESPTSIAKAGTSHGGWKATFEFDGKAFNAPDRVRSHAYLFTFVADRWIVKYRFSHLRTAEVGKDIEDFLAGLDWNFR